MDTSAKDERDQLQEELRRTRIALKEWKDRAHDAETYALKFEVELSLVLEAVPLKSKSVYVPDCFCVYAIVGENGKGRGGWHRSYLDAVRDYAGLPVPGSGEGGDS